MYKFVLLCLITASVNFSFAQNYSLVNKAEKRLNNKEYDKALRLLNRAENANYGFCGNARMEALFKIDSLKLRLYKETRNLKGLQKFLENVNLEMPNDTLYSKERIYLALNYYSKEELKKLLLKAISEVKEKDLKDDFGFVNLLISNNFKLKLPFNYFEINQLSENEKIPFSKAFLKIFQKSIYWEMLN